MRKIRYCIWLFCNRDVANFHGQANYFFLVDLDSKISFFFLSTANSSCKKFIKKVLCFMSVITVLFKSIIKTPINTFLFLIAFFIQAIYLISSRELNKYTIILKFISHILNTQKLAIYIFFKLIYP